MAKKKIERPPEATEVDPPFSDLRPDADRTVTYAEAGERTVAYDEYPTLSTDAAIRRAVTSAALADRTSDGAPREKPLLSPMPDSPPWQSRPVVPPAQTGSGIAAPRNITDVPKASSPPTRPVAGAGARPLPKPVEGPTATHEISLPTALPPPITFTSLPPPPPLPTAPRARPPGGPDTRAPTRGEAGASALCERSEPRAEPEGTESTCSPQPSRGYPWLAKKGSVEVPLAPLTAPSSSDAAGDWESPVPPADAPAPVPPQARAVRAPLLPPPAPAPPAPARPRSERRPLPRSARIAAAAVGGIVIALFVLSQRSGPKPTEPRLTIEDKLAVSEEDLKRRREVKPEDLRPREVYLQPPPSPAPVAAAPPPGEPTPPSNALAERRRRRANDPNDLLSHRKPSRSDNDEAPPATPAEADLYRRPLGPGANLAKNGGPGGGAESGAPKRRLASGTTLRGTLAVPLRLRGGTGGATAIATFDRSAGPLRGARILGQASLSGDRLELRFRKIVLPSGDEVSIQAEAQSPDGAFGLPVAIDEDDEEEGGSVIGEVATDTATEVVTDALGVGIPGRAATNYMQRSRSRSNRPTRRVTTVELPAGTPLQVFFHEAANLP